MSRTDTSISYLYLLFIFDQSLLFSKFSSTNFRRKEFRRIDNFDKSPIRPLVIIDEISYSTSCLSTNRRAPDEEYLREDFAKREIDGNQHSSFSNEFFLYFEYRNHQWNYIYFDVCKYFDVGRVQNFTI